MSRSVLLAAIACLVGCASPPERTLSVSVRVEASEDHDQYLFDVMVEEDGSLVANPKVLVKEGQEGRCQIGRNDNDELVLNVIAINHHEEESDR